MPKPLNEQINDIFAGTVTLILLGGGVYLVTNGEDLELRGVMAESKARLAGWLFIGYGLIRAWLVYKRITRRREDD